MFEIIKYTKRKTTMKKQAYLKYNQMDLWKEQNSQENKKNTTASFNAD